MRRLGAGRARLIWAAVIPIVLWVLVRALGLERGFPLVPLIAYTPYLTVPALLGLAVAAALRNWAAAIVAALALGGLVTVLLPRAVGDAEAVPPDAVPLDVLSVNIHHGTASVGDLLEMVERREAEILSVQELTPKFARELERRGIERLLPHRVVSVRRGAAGGGVYSSLALRRLTAPPLAAIRMPRASVRLPDGGSVRVVAVHPYPPNRSSVDLWRAGLDSLPATNPAGPPWILAGDFNATLDHAELREILDSGYRDAAEVTGEGLTPTWPARRRILPPVTIDHILADPRICIADYAVETLLGSDHRTVYARLAVPDTKE
ncbi:MAG TPA: endonuclease/exonuclease/phosphatase family protein [Solirubrobacterales bacterium]